MSTLVAASRRQVWNALTDPDQVVHWRPGSPERLDATHSHPRAGASVRWRCIVHALPLVLQETPVAVQPGERLHSRLSLGLFRFEETFTLSPAEGSAKDGVARTRLGLKISAANEMPTLGGSLDRFAVREFATQLAATYLQAVRDWCEGSRASQHAFPTPPVPIAASAAR